MKRFTSCLCAATMGDQHTRFRRRRKRAGNAEPFPAAEPDRQFQRESRSSAAMMTNAVAFVTGVAGTAATSPAIAVNRRDFERRGNDAYYRGHRGQRQARRGWRQHERLLVPAGSVYRRCDHRRRRAPAFGSSVAA